MALIYRVSLFGLWDYCVTPVPIGFEFGFGTALGLGFSLRGPDLGRGLDNFMHTHGILKDENCPSRADPLLGLNIPSYCPDWGYLNI